MSNDQFTKLFTYIERRFDEVDARFEQVDARFEQIYALFDDFEKRMETNTIEIAAHKLFLDRHENHIEGIAAKVNYELAG